MTFRFLNRVRMSVFGAPGTGFVTLNSPAAGFQAFDSAGMSDGDTTPYLIEDGSPLGSTWEIGVGTWHSNGTFTRTTVTQSSAGGTTPISASSSAVISAIFRAEDLANAELTPMVVQYATINTAIGGSLSETATITLPAPPTVGNHLIAIVCGGGLTSGSYIPGFTGAGFDLTSSWAIPDANTPSYGVRAVRSGDSATQGVGVVYPSTYALSAVLVEVSGLDITRFSEKLMARATVSGTPTSVVALSGDTDLSLMFVGGQGSQAVTVTSPTTVQVNATADGARGVFAYGPASDGVSGITFSVASGSLDCLVMNIPGV
jgi:hypothetical protein